MNKLLFAAIAICLCGCYHTDKQRNPNHSCSELDGKVFEYLPSPDVPKHLFTLLFNCKEDTLKGLIMGPDPEGGEVLAFFKSNLDSITVINNRISFSFVQKTLFEKPFTLDNYNKPFKNDTIGGSNYRLLYKGYEHSDTITFICTSEYGSCYADTMDFIAIKGR